MTRRQGGIVIILLFFIAAWTYVSFLAAISSHKSDAQNLVKIECFLHADNADVHKLCVDHGYDDK